MSTYHRNEKFYSYSTFLSTGLETTKPWKLSKGLGSLVVLCGGHVRSKDETLLCALDSEGRCNLFDVKEDHVTSDHDGSYVVSLLRLI